MSKNGEPKVRFLSLSSLQTSRGSFLLAESTLFTLPSLLFVADSGPVECAIAFFLLSTRFATSLTFVFRSSSPAFRAPAEPFHGLQRVARRSPATSSPCSSIQTRARRLSGRSLSVDGDSGSGSQASTLRHQGNFAEEHAAVALVAAKKKCSVSDKDVVKPRP